MLAGLYVCCCSEKVDCNIEIFFFCNIHLCNGVPKSANEIKEYLCIYEIPAFAGMRVV
jgi:hypothetical protein